MASTLIFSDSSITIWLWSYRCAKTAILGCGHFQAFRPGFSIWHICHVVRHGHFTLKQLRLSVLNEMHTNSYTGPRLLYLSYLNNTLTTKMHTFKQQYLPGAVKLNRRPVMPPTATKRS